MHIPVLSNEVIKLLDPQPADKFIDGTFGGGGHSGLIWQKIKPNGRLLAVDMNEEAIKLCKEKFQKIDCVLGNFADLPEIMEEHSYIKADGLLIDLGVSSIELENSGRGFSFRKDEPLLMTYNDSQISVKDILADISEEELAEVIKKYGEERFSKRIAGSIKKKGRIRRLETTGDLVGAILRAMPKNYKRGKIHPATRTFMALRIYANKELENLEMVLNSLENIIAPGGRVAIISFHSLEDRLVKQHFNKLAKANKIEILNKKPITASEKEVKENPRSRSAKLRVLKMI